MSKSKRKRNAQAHAEAAGLITDRGEPGVSNVAAPGGNGGSGDGASAAVTTGVPGAGGAASTSGNVQVTRAAELDGASASDSVPGATGVRAWAERHRLELLLFLGTFFVLACFSGPRFLRQSDAPHFIYQAKAWLEGRLDLDPQVLPNLEDWACVRREGAGLVRCTQPPRRTDHWYVSFPSMPALVMLPFVALHGYQFNDTSFGVIVGALALVFAFRFLRQLARNGDSLRTAGEDLGLALVMGFGTLFFYCALRGEVWFSAEVMGVAFTFLYASAATRGRHPLLAGVFYAAAVLTRTPLFFSLVFFLAELAVPGLKPRAIELEELRADPRPALRQLAWFALGAGPLAVLAALFNWVRFGRFTEFGHAFLFNNRVNADIDRFGLFSLVYLPRNLDSALLKLPQLQLHPLRLSYDPNGLSLLLTLPWLLLLFAPKVKSRLQLPLWLTVAACALPGLLYQNNGYMQFGFRFSLDYTPYFLALLAVSGWSFRSWAFRSLLAVAVVVNFWGAIAFRGYTELMRGF